mmetsp:Transcript_32087/g.31491  ORF Transcript_32087/g.31491 Transcript_32087/m.31491 type:complete len:133 (-) Transcript_32087:237-635(-)
MLTPDPRKRPDINKIIDILENWKEFDEIPLNDDAFKIKSKQEAISHAKNMKYTDMQADLLGFDEDPFQKQFSNDDFSSGFEKPVHLKHSSSMKPPQVPPPASTGWADWGKQTSQHTTLKTENMFDFGGFEQK